MGIIAEHSINQIRDTADIIDVISDYIQLNKKGINYFGLCPFHKEKTPSFSANRNKQIYKCFGCGVGGGPINFIMEIEKINFVDAIKMLAKKYTIDLDIKNINKNFESIKQQLYNIHEDALNYYQKYLFLEKNKYVLNYLHDRGFNLDVIKNFQLGFASLEKQNLLHYLQKKGYNGKTLKESGLFIDSEKGYSDRFRNRIIFPISDSIGRAVGFAGRALKDGSFAKYLNSPETAIYKKGSIFYGMNITKHHILESKASIIVEGYFDFLKLYQHGIKNVLAVSGTAFTNQHALIIKRLSELVYLMYDGDDAGNKASIKAGYILLKNGLSPKIVSIPDNLDPDDWVQKVGANIVLEKIKNSDDVITCEYNRNIDNLKDESAQTLFINRILTELNEIEDEILKRLYIKKISELTEIEENYLINKIKNIKPKKSTISDNLKNNSSQLSANKLIEDELIKLCFSENITIRNFIFENFDSSWFQVDENKSIYDKIYIHLHSENMPTINIILGQFDEKHFIDKLTSLLFDIEKFQGTLTMAKECVSRLEYFFLQNKQNDLKKQFKVSNNQSESSELLIKINKLQKLQLNINKKYDKVN